MVRCSTRHTHADKMIQHARVLCSQAQKCRAKCDAVYAVVDRLLDPASARLERLSIHRSRNSPVLRQEQKRHALSGNS